MFPVLSAIRNPMPAPPGRVSGEKGRLSVANPVSTPESRDEAGAFVSYPALGAWIEFNPAMTWSSADHFITASSIPPSRCCRSSQSWETPSGTRGRPRGG